MQTKKKVPSESTHQPGALLKDISFVYLPKI